MKRILLRAGARPNFVKIAPIAAALDHHSDKISYAIVHTGQHYDKKMSEDFFVQLGIPHPDINLEAGGGSQADQTASIMVKFEAYLIKNPCDLVIVVGDVTSTLACSIVAKKLNIKVAHVEGGIRSGDITMPEEINRLVTDSITDYFFTTTRGAGENLLREGKESQQIFFVGNTMIDTLMKQQPNFRPPELWNKEKLEVQQYIVLTLHRPSNVDNKPQLENILSAIQKGAGNCKIIFPIHPRTKKNMEAFELIDKYPNLLMIDSQSYLEFNYLVKNALGVITDSGGITEETTVMKVPCITLRNTTERPETCTIGTNELVGTAPSNIEHYVSKMIAREWKEGKIPELWDGKTAQRIAETIVKLDLLHY